MDPWVEVCLQAKEECQALKAVSQKEECQEPKAAWAAIWQEEQQEQWEVQQVA